MSDIEEVGIIKKALNGPATSISAIVIATVLVMQSFGIGSGSSEASNSSAVAFRERVTLEHKVSQVAVVALAQEMAKLTETNKEMLIILRDMKADARNRP